MLLKHTALSLAVFAAIAEARRRGGSAQRRKQQMQAAAAAAKAALQGEDANGEFDEDRIPAFFEPGTDELFESIMNGDYEDMVAEFHEEQIANGEFAAHAGSNDTDGFRGVGGPEGYSEDGFRGITLQSVINAGGPEYCRDMQNIRKENRPQVGMPGWTQWSQMMAQCKKLGGVMEKRRAACHSFLMKITYNPNRKYDLKPNEVTRTKYCQDITKLKNPWEWCHKRCPRGKKGRFCNRKKAFCNNKLRIWQENNAKLKENRESGALNCRPLPEGFKHPPPPNHPANNKRKCFKQGHQWTCQHIPGSDLPWCPHGYNQNTAGAVTGNAQGIWGNQDHVQVKPAAPHRPPAGKRRPSKKHKKKHKRRGGKRRSGGFRSVGPAKPAHTGGMNDPNSQEFQDKLAEMAQIDSQFGGAALNNDINKFQNNRNKRRKNRGPRGRSNDPYEEAVALSYTDDELRPDF